MLLAVTPVKTLRFEEIRERSIIGFSPWRLDSQGTREISILTSLTFHPTPHRTPHWLSQLKSEGAGAHRWGLYHLGIVLLSRKQCRGGFRECLQGLSNSVKISGTKPVLGLPYWTPALNTIIFCGRKPFPSSTFPHRHPHLEHLDYYHYNIGLHSSFISSLLASISL